jgi:hypothetical protein
MALVAVRSLASAWRTNMILAGGAVRGPRASSPGCAAPARRGSGGGRRGRDRERARLREGVGYLAALAPGRSAPHQRELAFGVGLAPTQATLPSWRCSAGPCGDRRPGPVEGGLVAAAGLGVDLPTAAAITALERVISYGFSTSAGAVAIALLGGGSVWNTVRGRYAPDSDADAARS